MVGAARRLEQPSPRLIALLALLALALIASARPARAQTPTPSEEIKQVLRRVYGLADRELVPPPGASIGVELARAREQLAELDAPPEYIAYAANIAAQELLDEHSPDLARIELRSIADDERFTERQRAEARVELAHLAIQAQDFLQADQLLQGSRVLVDTPVIVQLLASERPAEPHGPQWPQFPDVLIAARWYSARGLLEASVIGRPDRADAALANEELLAGWIDDPLAFFEAVDNRLRLELQLNDNAALLRFLEKPRVAPRLQALLAAPGGERLRPRIELRRATAEYELARKGAGDGREPVARLLAILRDELSGEQDRFDAALRVALAGSDAREAEWTREGLAYCRDWLAKTAAPSFSTVNERAILDALEIGPALESEDPEELQRVLFRAEQSLSEYANEWERVAGRRIGVAFEHSGDRYMIPSELLRGCLAAEGPERGTRRALKSIHRLQRIGGLANALLGADRGTELDADLAELCRDGNGVLLYQSGRQTSHLIAIDVSGTTVEEIASAWKLVDDCTALANGAELAIRDGRGFAHPEVRSALARLATDALGPRTRERMSTWNGATVIGDESFGHLPLELIDWRDGVRIGEHVPLAYAPSLPVAAELSRRARSRGLAKSSDLSTVLLGVPSSLVDTDGAPAQTELSLPHSRLESWRDTLAGEVDLFLGDRAVAQALCVPPGRSVQLLQVVAHGLHDSQRECPAGFLLAGADFEQAAVWAERVESCAAARITSLAVCGASGRPLVRGDDGRTGLAASFAISGSDCVLYTPTDLEASAAVDLFERITCLVTHGSSPARALVDARRERARDGRAELQDYLVHGWGAALLPIAEPALPPAHDRTAESRRGPWILAASALAALVAGAIAARRRSGRAA